MPNTTTVTLDLTYDEIRALQLGTQKLNADAPNLPGLAAVTSKIANIAYPSGDAPAAPPAPPAAK